MNTKQQEFDAVVSHLYTQGMPAKDGSACAYRTTDGLMCAVGCRIPDESYDVSFEGKHVHGLIKRANDAAIALPAEIGEYFNMFDKLQDIHDGWDEYADGMYSFASLIPRLETLAEDEGLTFNDPRRDV